MAKSLQQFEAWAWKAGRVANPGGSYPGQCVSLVQQYLHQVFGIPYKARGNAKDFVPPTFKRLPAGTKRKPGDIIRYGRNYGGGYGHIGLIDDDGQFLDQNGVKTLAVGQRKYPWSGIEAVYRPTKKFNVKTPKPAPKKKWATVLRYANVRVAPRLSAKLGGSRTLYKGDRFQYTSIVSGDKVSGNNKWYKSTKGNYVWSGNVKG